jgi:hypothetical protein
MGPTTAHVSVARVVLPLVLLASLLLRLSQARSSLSSSSSTSGPSIWGAILDEGPHLSFVGHGKKVACRSSSSGASGMTTDSWLSSLEASLPTHRPQAYKWGPEMVEDNGGTVLALAGPDYCIIGADTRLSSDYRIRTRNVSRLMEVSSHTYMGMAGSWADVTALRREVRNMRTVKLEHLLLRTLYCFGQLKVLIYMSFYSIRTELDGLRLELLRS